MAIDMNSKPNSRMRQRVHHTFKFIVPFHNGIFAIGEWEVRTTVGSFNGGQGDRKKD
jgi:hypothetical protein